jgi:hypothetical protein
MEVKNMIVTPTYPEIVCSLSGAGGSIQICIARFVDALKKGGVKKSEIEEIIKQATSSDKDHMFKVMSETVVLAD